MPEAVQESITADAELWNEVERRAWAPPEQITPPEWAEKYRYLTRRQTSRPGPWSNAMAPYLVGFMLLCVRAGVRMITVLKHSQGGWSEAMRCVIGYWAHLEPDPMLIVLPNKDKGKEIVTERLIPLFEDTEVLRKLATGRRHDSKTTKILLNNGFVLRLGYSGSIASVASDPARRVLCDERSKFEPDPKISLADSIDARTSTYEQSTIVNLSTPGADPDPTDELFEAADIKFYHFVKCPHCGEEQRLVWDALEWEPKKHEIDDKNKRTAAMLARESAWMNCQNLRCAELHPEGKGRMTDAHKAAMIARGCWATEDLTFRLFDDGREEGTWPAGATTVGIHAPAFISLVPKHRFTEIAAKYIRAEGDLIATQGVYNELFAEVYRPKTAGAIAGTFQKKCRPDPERGFVPWPAKKLPRWVARLVMIVDTQKDHFYYVIRGYGSGGRSIRIHHGKATSFEELTALADESFWPYESDVFPAMRVFMTAIDSGGGKMGLDASRTDAVYRWCLLDPIRRKPIKGESEPRGDQPIRFRRVTYQPPERGRDPYEVLLYLINVHHFQDLLASDTVARISITDVESGEVASDAEDLWQLNDNDDDEYCRQLSNMKRAIVRNGQKRVERWIKNTTGARVDYRMCEVYARGVVDGPAECSALPTYEQMRAARQPPKDSTGAGGGVRMPDGRKFGVWKR